MSIQPKSIHAKSDQTGSTETGRRSDRDGWPISMFDRPIDLVRKLEFLIDSPMLQVLRHELPTYGLSTKGSTAEPAVLIVVAAASVICGGDRPADALLWSTWKPRLRPRFEAAGYRVSATPPDTAAFRYYRDEILGGRFPDAAKEACRDMFANLAISIGLLPEAESDWREPLRTQVVGADGTWFAAASSVTTPGASRSKHKSTTYRTGDGSKGPRILNDVSKVGSGVGYNIALMSVRGLKVRQRVVLDVAHAPKGEMDVVVPAVKALVERVGRKRMRCFVYDGAMKGVHQSELRAAGLMTVNKGAGLRAATQWRKYRESAVSDTHATVFELAGIPEGCNKVFNLAGGIIWDVETIGAAYYRRRAIEVLSASPRRNGETFKWSVKLRVRCREHGHHDTTIDPDGTLVGISAGNHRRGKRVGKGVKKRPVNLADRFRLLGMNEEELFANSYGRRNDLESLNNYLKNFMKLGKRSRSYSVERLEFDLWVSALLSNTIVWAEHKPLQGSAERREVPLAA